MTRPQLEVADIFRRHGPAWRAANEGHLSLAQRRVMRAIELCRTAALGGHVERCADCAHTRIAYNSCRNRHCPKCQWPAAQAWLEAREAELLPVPYFHVVFTLPAALGAIAYQNKARVYGLLLKAAAETLTTIAADPEAPRGPDRRHRRAAHAGGRPSTTTRTCTASCRPAASRSTAAAGSPAGRASSCRCGCSRACSGACSSTASREAHGKGELEAFGDLAGLDGARRVQGPPGGAAAAGVGGLRQGPVRRAEAGAGLPRPLHPPGRDLEQPAGGARRRRPGELPLEGLPGERPHEAEGDAAARRASSCAASCCTCCPDGFHRIRHYGLFANGHRAAMLARCRELLDVPPTPAEGDGGQEERARREPRRCPPARAAAGRC